MGQEFTAIELVQAFSYRLVEPNVWTYSSAPLLTGLVAWHVATAILVNTVHGKRVLPFHHQQWLIGLSRN